MVGMGPCPVSGSGKPIPPLPCVRCRLCLWLPPAGCGGEKEESVTYVLQVTIQKHFYPCLTYMYLYKVLINISSYTSHSLFTGLPIVISIMLLKTPITLFSSHLFHASGFMETEKALNVKY